MPEHVSPSTLDSLMGLLAESAMRPTKQRPHVPLRAWQERPEEITWLCSCGCINKHVPLPANLRCVEDKENEDA